MAKYRKKPIVVEAEQWFKSGDVDGVVYYNPNIHFARFDYNPEKSHSKCGHLIKKHGWIEPQQSWDLVCPGDWIITGVSGEKSLCNPKEFELTYEKA